jgi:CheY-specific phosphatase CheX
MVTEMEDVLRSAVGALFMTMAGVEPCFKELRRSDEFCMSADVAGVMYLAGAEPGLVACGVSEELGRCIIGRMTGLPRDEISGKDLLDGLAEVVNIIAGHMKTQCPQMEISLTPPIALSGKECVLAWKTHRPVMSLEFEVEGEKFTVVAGL